MQKISNTLGGKISNVADSFNQFQITLGKLNSGALVTFVGYLQKALGFLNDIAQMSIDRAKFSASALVDGDELNRISADYNKQIAKIGATTDISALKDQLKFIQTNMTFYQQAMLTETDAKNRDVMASYFNAYKPLEKKAC